MKNRDTIEKTLVILKPDCIERKLVGRVISRFEDLGFVLLNAKFETLKNDLVIEHYREHKGKDFFKGLCSFMTISPVFLMIWSGKNIVFVMRKCVGVTDSSFAVPGSIRGDFSVHKDKNLIHASDSNESAQREIALFFPEN